MARLSRAWQHTDSGHPANPWVERQDVGHAGSADRSAYLAFCFRGGGEAYLTKPQRHRSAQRHWVYAYQIEPPHPDTRFSRVKVLLGKAHLAARRAARMWTARVVVETRVSHILIVSDSPSRLRAVNRALERELKRLGLRFLVNEPVPVPVPVPLAAAAKPV